MTKLRDVVSGILGELARSNLAAEEASKLTVSEQSNKELSFVSIPRARITNAQITLRFAVAPSVESQTNVAPSPEIKRIWEEELQNIANLSTGDNFALTKYLKLNISDNAINQILQGNSSIMKKEFEKSVSLMRKEIPVKIRRTLPNVNDTKLKMSELIDERLQAIGPKLQRIQTIYAAASRDLDILVSKDELTTVESDKIVDLTLQINLDELDTVTQRTTSSLTK